MNRRARRNGLTLVEVLVATTLLTLVLGGALGAFLVIRKQESKTVVHAGAVEALTAAAARLRMDLAAAYLPSTLSSFPDALEIGPDGASLTFLRTRPGQDPRSWSAGARDRVAVRWHAESTLRGDLRLHRTMAPGHPSAEHVQVFGGAPLATLNFKTVEHSRRTFLVCELAFETDDSSRPRAARVVRRLPTASRLPAMAAQRPPQVVLDLLPPESP